MKEEVEYEIMVPAYRPWGHDFACAWLHFSRFLECLCLSDGAGYSDAEDVADAVHWH